jgi:hypothetical protein
MTTLAALVDDCYGMLYGSAQAERPREDTLVNLVSDDADVTWEFTTPAMWKRDDYAEAADTAGEIVIMTTDHPAATNDVTVRRGQRGTTAKVAGYSAGDVFYKNPNYPRYEIERLINQVVRSELWPDVWTWHQDTLSFVSGDTTYNLDQYVTEVTSVYQYDLNSDGKFHPLPRTWWSYERQINTAVSTNSNLFRLYAVHDEAETVYYTAKRRPHPDDLANMSDELAELVPWAVVGKLQPGRGVAKRSRPKSSQDDSEGGALRDYRGFMAEFLRMRKQLKLVLMDEIPAELVFKPRRGRRRG